MLVHPQMVNARLIAFCDEWTPKHTFASPLSKPQQKLK